MHLPPERLNAILDRFSRSRILVIGDLMLDEFLWGKVTRISPEAPVPVVDIQRRASYPGGAANVARNLASLGAKAGLAGVIGDDDRNLERDGHAPRLRPRGDALHSLTSDGGCSRSAASRRSLERPWRRPRRPVAR